MSEQQYFTAATRQWINKRWLHSRLIEAAERRAQTQKSEKESIPMYFPSKGKLGNEFPTTRSSTSNDYMFILSLYTEIGFEGIQALFPIIPGGSISSSECWNTVLPLISIPTFCKGCHYYHGRNGIVCAIHPLGVGEDESCADWSVKPAAS